jgi:UDP-N-acetylglucosamine--N-acetylmuramyl-(pentapeptide) pyrophosphoryl-undecaprenol N-acetylglucosamine transferase
MTIVLVGGGSGGHITPILAVADELRRARPEIKLIYIGQKGDPLIDESYLISAGKFRRYHGEGIRQIFDLPTLGKNIHDFFRMLKGIWQSYRLLGKLKPAAIFTPGGFVGVPVGLAASRRHIPFVTHDLDALPGLANRINARHAIIHAVGLPKELYPYPPEKTEYVGVPTKREFKSVNTELQASYKNEAGLIDFQQIVFVIGGGQGAQRLNEAVLAISKRLLGKYPKLALVHTVGSINEAAMNQAYSKELSSVQRANVLVKGYLDDVYRFSGAADLVITRAGATNMAEFAVQQKACIVVPNPLLTGGHQIKNAQHLYEAGAIKLVTEEQLVESSHATLFDAIDELLASPEERELLGKKLGTYAKPQAALDIAVILLRVAG